MAYRGQFSSWVYISKMYSLHLESGEELNRGTMFIFLVRDGPLEKRRRGEGSGKEQSKSMTPNNTRHTWNTCMISQKVYSVTFQ